jgi:serine/threonine-protein kinase RsbW
MKEYTNRKIRSASAHIPAPCRLAPDEFVLWIDEVFPSDVRILATVLRKILAKIEGETQRGDLDRVELALDEALANAIIHGNQNDTSKAVRIGVALKRDGGLLIIVKDVGPGFDITRIPEPTVEENILMSHGRGIFLIKQLVDDVWFRFESGTEICMHFRSPRKYSE